MYKTKDTTPAKIIGSFAVNENTQDYEDSLGVKLEGIKESLQLDPTLSTDFMQIMRLDSNFESYCQQLTGNVVGGDDYEGSFESADMSSVSEHSDFEAAYYARHGAILSQLMNNSREECITEAANTGVLSPIMPLTMPILHKFYFKCQYKDMVEVVVSDKPLVNIAYERKFLKNEAGEKFYIPEVFYDDSYQQIMDTTVGKAITDEFKDLTSAQPLVNFNVLEASGGSIKRRDSLSYDFCIKEIKVSVETDTSPVDEIQVVNIKPNLETKTFNHEIKIDSQKTGGSQISVTILGNFDPYYGTVSLTAIGPVKAVKFGGHLSNSNNDVIVELDRERKNEQITISEKERLNTGFTLEQIQDQKALAGIDTVAELVTDMTEVLSQTKDSNMKRKLEDSFQTMLKAKNFAPMGYKNTTFAWQVSFPLGKPHDYYAPESTWRSPQIRYYFGRLISMLKQELKTEDIMFSISANPMCIDLLSATDADINWVINNDSRTGGVKMDYKVGITTIAGVRCQIISSMKESIAKGFRIVPILLTDKLITFRQYEYSFNIENNYRNPLTPNITNIMACQRYEWYEFLPLQGEFAIQEYKNGNYGLTPDFSDRP